MLLYTYGGLRKFVLRHKAPVLVIVLVTFVILYTLCNNEEMDESSMLYGANYYTFSNDYVNMNNVFGIGEVGMVPDYEAPLLETFPVLKPRPREFDEDGKEYGLRFMIIADWGGQSDPPYTTPVELNLAKSLGECARRYTTKFVLSLGDNFCDEGVKDVEDTRFQDTFENVFTEPALFRPWYLIAGNDDYKGNVTAQMLYTSKSRRWFFEQEYYKLSFQLPTYRNVTVDILMIDTILLCGKIPPGKYQPTEPEDQEEAEKHWKWIEKNLKKSTASYLLVAGHYPVFSGGRHGSTICLKRRLKPLLETYKVSAYFSGHDHSVQHYKGYDTKGIDYFITGATHPREDTPDHLDGVVDSSQFFWTASLDNEVGAFTYCDISMDMMSVAFVDTNQRIMYFTTILPRNTRKTTKKNLNQDLFETAIEQPILSHVIDDIVIADIEDILSQDSNQDELDGFPANIVFEA